MERLKRILCPVDFSESSSEVIEKASFLAQLFQADLTLLHVISVLPQSFGVIYGLDLNSSQMVETARENARDLLRDLKKKFVPYAITCKSEIRVGRPSEEILKAVQELPADLLIISTQGAGEGETPVMGAYTHQIISGAACPVLTFQAANPGSGKKGFRKIIIPVNEQMVMGKIKGFLTRYFSIMGPDVLLVTIIPEDATPHRESVINGRLEGLLQEIRKEGYEHIESMLVRHNNPSDVINRVAAERKGDLVMMTTHGKSGEGHLVLGSTVAGVINDSGLPVFTVRPELP